VRPEHVHHRHVVLFPLAFFTILFCGQPQALSQPRALYVVDSIAQMEALEGAKFRHIRVASYHADLNRGGGDFTWNAGEEPAPDRCTTFRAGKGGRWLRQVSHGVLDVTMCGVRWDGTDDSAALSNAFTVASRSGFSLSCPGGTGVIAATVAPASFNKVMLRCQGMETSKILCTVPDNRRCFLFQNARGAGEVQAPQFFDLEISARTGSRTASVLIQYNSIGGGFTDTPQTQGYMMRPIVQRVRLSGGGIGIQCSKCFDGDFSLNQLLSQERHGIALEGSDWMGIGKAGTNRIVSTGGFPIKLASHGTFGNGAMVSHNDILWPRKGVGAYIYSSARTSYIEYNFLEGATSGACEIKIDMGATHAVVRGNHVTDPTVKNWLCVVPELRQAEFSSNQTTSRGQGPALFENRGYLKDWLLRHKIVHFGNWSEQGIPTGWFGLGIP